jgi:hypothetical protein
VVTALNEPLRRKATIVSDPRRYRISDDTSVPPDVTDPLLWRLAIDVLAAHQPGGDGRCRNLQCALHREDCPASVAARGAMRLARPSRPVPHAVAEGATPPSAARTARTVSARGRACVPGRGFGWFTRPPLPAPRAPAPMPAPSFGVLAAA